MKKTVTVFGSSKTVEGEDEFNTAYKLGKLLTENDFVICSGGYQGIMNAVSKGASENGSEAIGVIVNGWTAHPSKFLTKVVKCNSLFERILKLIELGDAYVILQGGTGTLLELAAVWELNNKNLIDHKPVVCHSSMWKRVIDIIDNQLQKENRETGLVKCFDDVMDIVNYLISELK
jgi:uncharacterized protein (TIGR00730 family)